MKRLELPNEIEVLDCIVPVRYLHNPLTTEICAYGKKKLRQNPPGGRAFITLPESLIPRWDELKAIEKPFLGEEWEVGVEFKNLYSVSCDWDKIVEDARLNDSNHYEKWQSHCEKKPELFELEDELCPALKDVDLDSIVFPEPVKEVYGTDRKGDPLIATLQPSYCYGYLGDLGEFKKKWYLNHFEGEAKRRRAQEKVESAKKRHRMCLVMKDMIVPDSYDYLAEFPKPQMFEGGWIALIEDYGSKWKNFIGFKAEYFLNHFDDKVLLEEVVMANWEKAKARFEGPRSCWIAIRMIQEHLQSRNLQAAKKFSKMFSSIKERKLGLDQVTYGGDFNDINSFAAGATKNGNWTISFQLSETRTVELEFGSDPVANLKAIKGEIEKGILKEAMIE